MLNTSSVCSFVNGGGLYTASKSFILTQLENSDHKINYLKNILILLNAEYQPTTKFSCFWLKC